MAAGTAFIFGLNPVTGIVGDVHEGAAHALVSYLSDRLNRAVKLGIEPTYRAQIAAMRAGVLDAAVFGAYAFYRAREDAGAVALAMSVEAGSRAPRTYQSVIVASADSLVSTLHDLRGLRVGFVDSNSTAGYLIPRRMIREAGLDPDADLMPSTYSTHQAVLDAVLAGTIDAGALHRGVFGDRMADFAEAADRLRVIATSPPVPTGPVAVRPGLDSAVQQRLLQALLTIHEDEMAARLVLAPGSRFRPVSSRSVTLKMVAALAGTSYGTVSRVINGEGRVAPGTHARVMSIVQDLGFRPNAAAVSLVAHRSNLVGMLAPDVTDAGLGDYLSGAQRVLGARGIDVVLCSTGGDRDAEERYLRLLENTRFGGMLLTPWSQNTAAVSTLAAAGHAMVLLGAVSGSAPVPSVAPDMEQALIVAQEHLQGLGHARIAGLVPASLLGVAVRHLGLAHSVEPVTGAVWANNQSRISWPLEELLALPSPPTAIICGSERIALAVLREAHARCIAVPASLSMVALGDSWLASLSTPPLTTVALPYSALGERAAAILLEQMSGAPSTTPAVLPAPVIVPRASSSRLKHHG